MMRKLLHSLWRFWKKAWGLIILAAFFIWTHFLTKDFNAKMRQERRYTVGEVYDTHWTPKSGQFADARFYVKGQKYLVSADADAFAGQRLIGRRFLVKFHPPDPLHYNVLYLNASVPDSVQTIEQGWSTPPFSVPEKVFEYGDEE